MIFKIGLPGGMSLLSNVSSLEYGLFESSAEKIVVPTVTFVLIGCLYLTDDTQIEDFFI